ncbi:MAG: hypothetical protein V4479_11205 [Actinomycetota bacterium]
MRSLLVIVTVIGVFVAIPLFVTVILGGSDAVVFCGAGQNVRCTVSSDPKELATTLITAYGDGTFRDTRPEMIADEIAPMAAGTASRQCSIDVRVLQVIVLALQRFASVGVSDLGRPCAGMSLDCPGSAHCAAPDLAVDFVSIAGEPVNGYSTADVALLRFLDAVVPRGTVAGQSQCRAQHDQPAVALANISRFPDDCTHQHIDFHATTAALTVSD